MVPYQPGEVGGNPLVFTASEELQYSVIVPAGRTHDRASTKSAHAYENECKGAPRILHPPCLVSSREADRWRRVTVSVAARAHLVIRFGKGS